MASKQKKGTEFAGSVEVNGHSPEGNYCSRCELHDQWCEHIQPPKQEQGPFPPFLYVSEPFATATSSPTFDGYRDWHDCEEGDIVAVYELKSVNRVRVEITKTLVDEDSLKEDPNG